VIRKKKRRPPRKKKKNGTETSGGEDVSEKGLERGGESQKLPDASGGEGSAEKKHGQTSSLSRGGKRVTSSVSLLPGKKGEGIKAFPRKSGRNK